MHFQGGSARSDLSLSLIASFATFHLSIQALLLWELRLSARSAALAGVRAGDIVLDLNGISFMPFILVVYSHIYLLFIYLFLIYYVFLRAVYAHVSTAGEPTPSHDDFLREQNK